MAARRTIAVRYVAFAAVATGVNIASQVAVFAVYPGPGVLWLAMAVGTGTGLVTKYALDRRWIFDQPPASFIAHSVKFSRYTGTGVLTTLLFWLTEWVFDTVGGTAAWRYTGAVIGLAAGYAIKYRLDKRYVFR